MYPQGCGGSSPFDGTKVSLLPRRSLPIDFFFDKSMTRDSISLPYNCCELAMPANLDQIVAATRRRLAEIKPAADLRQLDRQAGKHVPRGFRRGLESASQDGVAVIAELKRASPSRGLIRDDFDPEILAQELESAGAAALSVLTDAEFFQGSLQNLRRASACTMLPCLRKDFLIDEFQLLEARANGADAVLLIVAALSQDELKGWLPVPVSIASTFCARCTTRMNCSGPWTQGAT